ncbi:hypothetical protein [Streptomyces katrae]|uniref:hypothetical protein n=1 Tax=Streptomyces katrae TaxID=68223 RepID=UPI000AB4D651|nr:hypothetical protein [Streptomyces katrae]
MPEEIDELPPRTNGAPTPEEGGTELAGLHHATGLALAAALRAAGPPPKPAMATDHILVLPHGQREHHNGRAEGRPC